MVFSSVIILSVANASANVWQYIACFTEHISNEDLLDLVCCFPLQQLGRMALCLWTFFCVPPSPASSYYFSYYDSDSDSNSSSTIPDDDNDDYHHYSHSD